MSDDVRTPATWTRQPTSPEVVRTCANVAAVVEIGIRKAANSAAGRALAAVVREYPLWSVFIASTVGYLVAPRHRPPGPPYKPAPAPAARGVAPPKPRT